MGIGFDFSTAQRIIFGPGALKELAPVAGALGKKALVVVGRSADRAAAAIAALESVGVRCNIFRTSGEPTAELVQEGAAVATVARSAIVISLGGGSVIDAGKAIAALAANPGEVSDYLEVVGKGQPLKVPSRAFIAIPTTAGTGSEATRNAVLAVPSHRIKVSLRGSTLLPRVAIVDPELTYGAPKQITAASGMDALTQLIESYVSLRSNAMTDALCRDGLPRAARSIRAAHADGSNIDARADMALAALFSGMALANAGLGAAHGLAGPIGGLFAAPHGAVCGALIPALFRANVAAARRGETSFALLPRFNEVATLLTGNPGAVAEEGAAWLQQLTQDLGIPGLGFYGLTAAEFPDVISRSGKSSSMKGNPVALTETELRQILEESL